MALPSLGTVTYGPLSLNGPSVLTTGIRSNPVPDAAGRGRKWTEYTISLKLTVTGRPTDAEVLSLRRTLTTPGLAFRYEDRGYGPLRISAADDVLWGPNPKELGFKPLGGGNACQIDWQVTVAVACEDGGGLVAGGGGVGEIIEWVYGVSYDIDPAGYTTRRINVTIRVPGSRGGVGRRQLLLTADEYRDKLTPPAIPGFRRTYPGWTIDESKTTCSGEIVDEEMGVNYPPEWVASLDADEEIASANEGLHMWGATINANYELVKAAPVPTSECVRHFLGVIVRDRINALAAQVGKNSTAIVPISLRMRNPELYGRRKASLSFSYRFTQPLKDILSASTLWRPVPGSNWAKWAASMQLGPASPRGFVGLELRPGDDSIVDGCGGKPPGIFVNRTPAPTPPVGPGGIGLPTRPPNGVSINTYFPDPTPQGSWLFYDVWTWVEVDSATVPVRTLPTKAPKGPLQTLITDPFSAFFGTKVPANFFDADLANPFLMPKADPKANPFTGARLDADMTQQRARPTIYVYLRGKAARHGFPIPIPALTDFGGSVPVLACRLDRGEGFGQGITYGAGEEPIYGATWNIRYQVVAPDGWFPPVLPNPLLAPKP